MRVLIVDDNKSITDFVEKQLSTKGYDVTVCNDGHDGLRAIESGRWGSVLLDVSMSGLNGFDIIDILERNDSLRRQNIILCSASTVSEEMKKKMLSKDGIRSFLKKPESVAQMMATIA